VVRKLPAPRVPEATPVVPAAAPGAGAAPEERPVPGVRPSDTPPRSAEVRPLAPDRYKVQFTVSRDTYEKLRRAQDLLRHAIPSGDPAAVFDRALTALLNDLAKRKLATTPCPRAGRPPTSGSRHMPAAVKRQVWHRDGGRCAFAGTTGRCTETGFLEFHHVVPYGEGGQAVVGNVELRCRAHNAYESEQWFGTSFVREASQRATWAGTRSGTDFLNHRVDCVWRIRRGSPNAHSPAVPAERQ
jgi:hypothetical protein